jgi:hypothetical protein
MRVSKLATFNLGNMTETSSKLRHWAIDDIFNDENNKKSFLDIVGYNVDFHNNIDNEIGSLDVSSFKTVNYNFNNQSNINLKFDAPFLAPSFNAVESRTYSKSVQKWQGFVTEISEDTFQADLIDLTAGGTKETGEFSKVQVRDEDLSLLKIGAAFYWFVGVTVQNSQAKSESVIRFQRLIKWTENNFDSAADRAKLLFTKFAP